MPIPESQLETWSHQGSITQSSDTYQTIRNALLSSKALYAEKSFEVFLQGSYGNDTNIYAESDVDTVIRLDSIYRGDVSGLPIEQQIAYQLFLANGGRATYTFDEFKKGVVTRLSTAFGEDYVQAGNKAIKVKPNDTRRSADVVACYEYRRFTRFVSESDQDFISGIIFPSTSSGEVINYPRLHSENLTQKHQATNSWFKPTVRIFKNMRSRLVDDEGISKDTAPSYYIEGMLHNVPNDKFGISYVDTFCNCVNWLVQADRSKFKCAHGQYLLLGNSNVQWPSAKCTEFLNALVKQWQNW
jgi:hypothetical protein